MDVQQIASLLIATFNRCATPDVQSILMSSSQFRDIVGMPSAKQMQDTAEEMRQSDFVLTFSEANDSVVLARYSWLEQQSLPISSQLGEEENEEEEEEEEEWPVHLDEDEFDEQDSDEEDFEPEDEEEEQD